MLVTDAGVPVATSQSRRPIMQPAALRPDDDPRLGGRRRRLLLGAIGKHRPRKARKLGASGPAAVAEVVTAEAELNDELPAWM